MYDIWVKLGERMRTTMGKQRVQTSTTSLVVGPKDDSGRGQAAVLPTTMHTSSTILYTPQGGIFPLSNTIFTQFPQLSITTSTNLNERKLQ